MDEKKEIEQEKEEIKPTKEEKKRKRGKILVIYGMINSFSEKKEIIS